MPTLFGWVFLQKRNVSEICIFQMFSIIIFVIPNGQIRTQKESCILMMRIIKILKFAGTKIIERFKEKTR